ncbi:MAG: hemerythrin family protein [Elusimicrobiota bacterium]
MTTGIDSLDEQHRRLFDMINEIERLVLVPASDQNDKIASLIAELCSYVKNHFAHEEGLMEKHKCSTAQVNKLAHERFNTQISTWVGRWQTSKDSKIVDEMGAFLGQWLSGHICTIDVGLRRCLPPSKT